jgi:hypothetical protein
LLLLSAALGCKRLVAAVSIFMKRISCWTHSHHAVSLPSRISRASLPSCSQRVIAKACPTTGNSQLEISAVPSK